MARPKKPEADKSRAVSITLPPDVWERLRQLARDEHGRALAGGVSGAIRSIVVPHLARQTKREAARS